MLDEAEEARKRNILTPGLIERVEPPMGFRRIHAADLIGWQGELDHPGLTQLIEDIESFAGPPPQRVEEERRRAEEAARHQAGEQEDRRRAVAEAEAKRKADEEQERRRAEEAKGKSAKLRAGGKESNSGQRKRLAAAAVVVVVLGAILATSWPQRKPAPSVTADQGTYSPYSPYSPYSEDADELARQLAPGAAQGWRICRKPREMILLNRWSYSEKTD